MTPDGTWIHEKGIEPTIEVNYPDYYKRTVIDRSETYKEGMISSHIETINVYLKELGYTSEKIGKTYTAATTQAIKTFQEKEGIKVTGEANKETVEKLETAIYNHWKENDIQYNKAVEVIQQK